MTASWRNTSVTHSSRPLALQEDSEAFASGYRQDGTTDALKQPRSQTTLNVCEQC
jgi:hypothetical protein